MNNRLLHIGITHKTAPLEFRERLRCDAPQQRKLLEYFACRFDGCFVLSTCERLELYFSSRSAMAASAMAFVAEALHLPVATLSSNACVLSGTRAGGRLLSVAAGLESRIVGEPHILGQVRRAYESALQSRSLDPVLASLGRSAIRAGKRVRNETALGRRDESVVKLTVNHVEGCQEAFSDRTVAVLGSGGLAREIVNRLVIRRVGRIVVVARDLDRASAVASSANGEAASLDRLPDVVSQADALIVCTSATRFLVEARHLSGIGSGGLDVVDLSVPRNVDPGISEIAGINLCHIDDLVGGVRGHIDGVDEAHRIVRDELDRFVRWRRERGVAPIIERLVRNRAVTLGRLTRNQKKKLHQRIIQIKQGVAA